MKSIQLHNTLTFALFIATLTVYSQFEIYTTQNGQSDYYSGTSQKLVSIGVDDFLMVSYIAGEKFLDRFNSQHEKIYSIPMLNAGYHSNFRYLPESNTITVIEYEPYGLSRADKQFRIYGSRYNANTGELLKRKEMEASAESYWKISFSPNNKYFAMWAVEYPLYAKIYDTRNIELLGELHFHPEENDRFFDRVIADNGTVLLAHMTENDQIRFNFFSKSGELIKSVKVSNALNEKENHKDARIHNFGSTAYATCFHQVNYVSKKFFSWEIDFDNFEVNEFVEFELDKRSIADLFYHYTYPGLILNKPEKMSEEMKLRKLGALKYTNVNDVVRDESGNVIFIISDNLAVNQEASSYNTTAYGSKYMLLAAFSASGQHLWGTTLNRRVQTKTDRLNKEHPFRPQFSGIETRLRSVENKLHLINFENPSPVAFGTVYRIIDTRNGELISASLLFEEKDLITNMYYMDWIGNNRVIAIAKKGQNFKINSENIRMKTIELAP